MVTLKEDTRKYIAELTLMDDIFMNKVFDNDIGRYSTAVANYPKE